MDFAGENGTAKSSNLIFVDLCNVFHRYFAVHNLCRREILIGTKVLIPDQLIVRVNSCSFKKRKVSDM